MRKLVPIKDIYTDNVDDFTVEAKDIPFITFALEIIDNPEIKSEDTQYYKWIEDRVLTHGVVWDWIKDKEQIIQRVNEFRELIKSIKEKGYDDELCQPLYIRGDNIYGEITARHWKDGYKLIDGHHKLSILIALGCTEVKLTICE